jgi:hypothetical protein
MGFNIHKLVDNCANGATASTQRIVDAITNGGIGELVNPTKEVFLKVTNSFFSKLNTVFAHVVAEKNKIQYQIEKFTVVISGTFSVVGTSSSGLEITASNFAVTVFVGNKPYKTTFIEKGSVCISKDGKLSIYTKKLTSYAGTIDAQASLDGIHVVATDASVDTAIDGIPITITAESAEFHLSKDRTSVGVEGVNASPRCSPVGVVESYRCLTGTDLKIGGRVSIPHGNILHSDVRIYARSKAEPSDDIFHMVFNNQLFTSIALDTVHRFIAFDRDAFIRQIQETVGNITKNRAYNKIAGKPDDDFAAAEKIHLSRLAYSVFESRSRLNLRGNHLTDWANAVSMYKNSPAGLQFSRNAIHMEICLRAYLNFQRRAASGAAGSPVTDWMEAEYSVLNELAYAVFAHREQNKIPGNSKLDWEVAERAVRMDPSLRSCFPGNQGNLNHCVSDTFSMGTPFCVNTQGSDIAVADINHDGAAEIVVFFIDDNRQGNKENTGYYRVGSALDKHGCAHAWSGNTNVGNWYGAQSAGAGIALLQNPATSNYNLYVQHFDNPSGQNGAYYKLYTCVTPGGEGRACPTFKIDPKGFGNETEASGITFVNLNGQQCMMLFYVDGTNGENAAFYRIGYNVDHNSGAIASWSDNIGIPGWFGASTQGGGITVIKTKSGRQHLAVFFIDNPTGENMGYVRIGVNLKSNGMVEKWSETIPVVGWYGGECTGGGISAAQLDKESDVYDLFVHNTVQDAGVSKGCYRVCSIFGLD